MTPTDEQLMAAYRGGDVTAFDTLYERYRGAVYRFVHRQLDDAHDPDSVFQDVWMKVIRYQAQWHDEKPFKPWLFAIANNTLIDATRRRKHQPQGSDDSVIELQAPHHPPDRWQHIRDCIDRLLALLESLPDTQRTAFLLKEEAGLTLQEIAEVAEVGRETIKSRLRYALQSIRRGLEGCEHA
jgi:RNA polymerase sigma factor (sigma-70 family)